jgi:hypothetical protein
VAGNYCHACGQKLTDPRYTIKNLTSDLFFSAFHLEKKGLPYTIKALTFQPGTAIKDVLKGKRLTLYPAFKYLVLMGALVILFSLRYRFFHNEITQVDSNDMNVFPTWIAIPEAYHMSIENFFLFAEDKATVLNIVAIPVFAFFSFAFLSGRKYNFAENLILNTFITAQQLFFILLLVPFLEFFSDSRDWLIGLYTIAIVVYNVWVYVLFFDGRKSVLLIKSSLVVLIAYIYQFPLNFVIFLLYDNYIHHHMHWIPHVYDHLVG